jgi:hypothetical protein
MVGTADAVEMVLDVAECEARLVEIVEVINHFQFVEGAASVAALAQEPAKAAPNAEIAPRRILRRCM